MPNNLPAASPEGSDSGTSWRFIAPLAIAAFTASEVFSHWLSIRFAMQPLGQMYQYLDPELLRSDLVRSLWHLHAQPPAFNGFLGLGLKLFPSNHALFFEMVFGACGLGLLMALAALMRRLAIPRVWVVFSVFTFALTPGFMVYRDWLFYTFPVACLLVWSALSLDLSGPRGRSAAMSLTLLGTLLMMTRAVFHPVWWFLVWCLMRVQPRRSARRLRWVFLGPFLVMMCLFGKNLFLVDSFGASSWLGMNLAKRWPLSQREMRQLKDAGDLPEFWGRRPFMEPVEFRPYGFFDPVAEAGLHPAIAAAYKDNGGPNFNHRDYAEIARRMLAGDRFLIRHYPGRYLRRVATSVLLFLQPGPNSVDFLVEYDSSRVNALRDGLDRLWLAKDVERPIRMLTPSVNLLLPVFLALLSWGLYQSIVAPERERAVFRFMTFCIVWVFLVTNAIEIGENDRMRWEIEPFLWVLATHGLYRLSRYRGDRARVSA